MKELDGIIRYDIEPAEKSLLIVFDDRVTTPDKIVEHLAARGYNIAGAGAGDPARLCP